MGQDGYPATLESRISPRILELEPKRVRADRFRREKNDHSVLTLEGAPYRQREVVSRREIVLWIEHVDAFSIQPSLHGPHEVRVCLGVADENPHWIQSSQRHRSRQLATLAFLSRPLLA